MSSAASSASLNGDQPRVDPLRYRRNVRVYYLFMAATGLMIFMPIWIIYLINERGLSLTEVAVFESFFWLTVIIAEVPTGAIADRFGRRISLALGSTLFAISTLIFAVASNFAILLSSYLVMGVAMTLYSGASEAMLYDSLRVMGRTREYERHAGRSHGLFWGMMVISTAVGGPVAYLLGYSLAIGLSAICLILAACAALLLREPPRRESDFPDDPLHAPPAGMQHAAQDDGQGPPILHEVVEGFRIVWRIRTVRYVIPCAAVLLALFDMPRFLTQPFVASHGLDPLASVTDGFIWSALLIPAYMGTVFGLLLADRLLSKMGERRSFVVILLWGAVFMAPLVIWNHLGLLGAIFMVSIAQATIRPIASGYINRRITSDQRATVLSIYSLIVGAAMSVILIGIVPVADIWSFPAAFGVGLIVTLTLGAALWWFWRRAHLRDQAERLRAWSIPIAKPQAARQSLRDATRPHRAVSSNGLGRDGGDLYRNVQNAD